MILSAPTRRSSPAIPESGFNTGLTPATLRVRPNRDLECVEVTLETADMEFQLALSIHSAIDALLRLVSALDSLTHQDRDR
jgi:hypothetical protein